MLTAKYKKIFSICIKSAVVLLSFWFVYHKISTSDNLTQFFNQIQTMPKSTVYGHLGIVFLLMFVNWLIESQKWVFLMQNIEKISFVKSIESVFCGLCWAIFTPNRIGEYGGRIFFLAPRKRVFGVIAMTVGNIAQMVLTNIFGAMAITIFLIKFEHLPSVVSLSAVILCLAFCVFLLIFYFNIKWLITVLMWIPFLRQYQKFFKIFGDYQQRDLLKVLGYALLRFVVFTSQYFILFHWLMPSLHHFDIVLMTLILLFIQSALPSLDIFDVGVRSITALYFFRYITTQEVSVIAGTAGIWLVNIIIPAILGSFFVFKLNFFDKSPR